MLPPGREERGRKRGQRKEERREERREEMREERVLLPPALRVYRSGLAVPVCHYALKRADASDR